MGWTKPGPVGERVRTAVDGDSEQGYAPVVGANTITQSARCDGRRLGTGIVTKRSQIGRYPSE